MFIIYKGIILDLLIFLNYGKNDIYIHVHVFYMKCGSIVNETSGTASLLGNVILLEFNGEYHMSARSHVHEKYVRI